MSRLNLLKAPPSVEVESGTHVQWPRLKQCWPESTIINQKLLQEWDFISVLFRIFINPEKMMTEPPSGGCMASPETGLGSLLHWPKTRVRGCSPRRRTE